MKGLEYAKLFYEGFGAAMISRQFSEYQGRIAVGLAGEGSECFGFDDQISRDHDWCPSFCLWITDEDEPRIGAHLQAEYQKLEEIMRAVSSSYHEAAGRRGVIKSSDYYRKYLGIPGAPQTIAEWRRIPETFLATAVNGEVFRDDLGEFSEVRNALINYYPDDLRLKKLSHRLAVMAQSGQYNYSRCIKRGEYVAAEVALSEFVQAACSFAYLINKKYMPFYKWAHHGIQFLPKLASLHRQLNDLYVMNDTAKRERQIETIASIIKNCLREEGLSYHSSTFLMEDAKEVMGNIKEPMLRDLHIMAE